jgi:hypothetical protein
MRIRNLGLTEKALKFLKENQKKVPSLTCPKCGAVVLEAPVKQVYATESVVDLESAQPGVASSTVSSDGEMELNERLLKNGEFAREFVQTAKWAGDAVFAFLSLETQSGESFEWSDEEMEEAMEND